MSPSGAEPYGSISLRAASISLGEKSKSSRLALDSEFIPLYSLRIDGVMTVDPLDGPTLAYAAHLP